MCDDMFHIKIAQKSNDIANEARITGNDRFSVKNFLYALNHYNRSISYAKSNNVAALAYGNRSAAYFEVKLYQECLENIQLARSNGYPANKMSKLDERENKCKELMSEGKDEKTEDLWDFFKLSYEPNEKIPWVVDCVEMGQTEKYGRGIYAKQDLKAGDVICVEDAFFHYTCYNKYNHYFFCYNCHKSNNMNLMPCDKTASIMFCSSACQSDFNLKAADMMKDILCGDVKLLSEVAAHFGGIKAFDDYINRTDLKTFNKTIFDYDLSDPEDPEHKNKLMTCFLSLSKNKNQTKNYRQIRKYVSKKTSDHLLSMYNLNQKQMSICDGLQNMLEKGHAIPLFASLINHSCVRNAQIICVENKAVTILIRPVKAGEQIFFCYTPYIIIILKEMKENLEAKHLFKCDCLACKNGQENNNKEFSKNFNEDINTMLKPNPAFLKDYEKAKQVIKKSWIDINNNPPPFYQFASPSLNIARITLESIAFQCSFPFPAFRG